MSIPPDIKELLEILRREIPMMIRNDAGFRKEIVEALRGEILVKDDFINLVNMLTKLKNDLQLKIKELEGILGDIERRLGETHIQALDNSRRLDDISHALKDIEEKLTKLNKDIESLRERKLPITDEAYREIALKLLSERFGTRIRKWETFDDEGFVLGHPASIAADLMVKNNKHILLLIKSVIRESDVGMIYRIGKLYEKKLNIKPSLMIVCSYIEDKAKKSAEELGIKTLIEKI